MGSSDPSRKNTDPCVKFGMGTQLATHQIRAGSSMGSTVLIVPFDLMRAFIAPVAPCEWPKAPISVILSLLKKMLAELLLEAMRKFAPSRIVWPAPVILSRVAMITKPQDAMWVRNFA